MNGAAHWICGSETVTSYSYADVDLVTDLERMRSLETVCMEKRARKRPQGSH